MQNYQVSKHDQRCHRCCLLTKSYLTLLSPTPWTVDALHWIFFGEGVLWGSLVAQTVKTLPAMQETQVQSLDKEAPLEKGMATLQYSRLENCMDRSLVGYSPQGCKEWDTTA